MAIALRLAHFLTAEVGDKPIKAGSAYPQTATSLTTSGDVALDDHFTLATATNLVLYDSSTAPNPSDFEFFYLVSDQDLSVEIRGTTAADNSNLTLAAGIPLILGSDQTRAYDAGGAFAGAAQSITRITVRNDSGSTANIRRIVAT